MMMTLEERLVPSQQQRWATRLEVEAIAPWLQRAVAQGLLDEARGGRPAALFHDLDLLRARLGALRRAFPAGTLHAVAVKANPLVEVLRVVAAEPGCGLEAATWEEASLALAAGCPAQRVVYDSPARTRAELAAALEAGIGLINADSLDELARIAAVMRQRGTRACASRIGLRVNPCVGEGRIGALSVAGPRSRFGQPFPQEVSPQDLARAILEHGPMVSALHVHVGSQGCGTDLLVAGVERCLALADAIDEAAGRPQIEVLDIGGGLPVIYRPGVDPAVELGSYLEALHTRLPRLFDGRRRLVTEMGRSVQAPCGWAATRVESVKRLADGRRLASLHLGADLVLRVAYVPEEWHLEVSVFDPQGRPRVGAESPCTLAGPLCFGGDLLAVDRALPPIEEGDLVVLHDVGAYTLGMWSRHCSRGMPPVYGYGAAQGFELLRAGESPQDVVRFWSRGA